MDKASREKKWVGSETWKVNTREENMTFIKDEKKASVDYTQFTVLLYPEVN